MPQPPPAAPSAMVTPRQCVSDLWRLGGLDPAALAWLSLAGPGPLLASSFAVATAAQASIAAAALAATEMRHRRGQPRQHVALDRHHAAAECNNAGTAGAA